MRNNSIKSGYRITRDGYLLILKKWERKFDRFGHPAHFTEEKKVFSIDTYWFIRLPFILLLFLLIYMRYQACMEIFNSFWYCAMR